MGHGPDTHVCEDPKPPFGEFWPMANLTRV